jgi:hypothetical protein
MVNEKVYVLKRGGESWHEVCADDIQKWLYDGSIEEGDLVFYPKKVMKAVVSIKLEELR